MKIYVGRIALEKIYPYLRLIRIRTPEERTENLFLLDYVPHAGERFVLGYVRIGYLKQKEGEHISLTGALDGLPEEYFSLGQSLEYYEKISGLGARLSSRILKTMRDVAASKDLLNSAKNEIIFNRSLVRKLGAVKSLQYFHAERHGKSAKVSFDYGCNLNGSKISTACRFDFDRKSPFNGAINVLIGRNGCGKSQYLANLVASLTGENNVGNFSNDDRQQFDKVIAVSYSMFDRFFLPDDIKIGGRKERTSVLKNELRYKYIGMRDKNGEGAVKVANPVLLSKKFSTALESIAERNQLQRWKQIMSPVLLDAELDIASSNPAIIRASFKKLGAGHKATLSILTGLFDELVPKSLVVVDEPENHLHPALIGHLVQALQKMLVYKESVAIVATHSPIIVQEFPSKFVRVIRKIDGVSMISPLRERSFGRSLDSIVSAVFGVPTENPGYMTRLQDLIDKGWSLSQIEKSIGEELGPAARSYVISELENR